MDIKSKLETIENKSVSDFIFDDSIFKIIFDDGTIIEATYWRLSTPDTNSISSFDNLQSYGLDKPINVVKVAKDLLGKKIMAKISITDNKDLNLLFQDNIVLEIFNFSAYEVWELKFPDGTSYLSNYQE